MTWVQGSKVTRVTRASQGSTDHREREELWSQGQRVNQDLTDPLVYLGKMERSNLRVRLVCKDCEGQRVRGKGIPGERILLLHRFLPIDLRALGDQYVKDEFRRNKTAAPEEVTVFMREWGNYRDTLQTQVLESARDRVKKVEFGAELSEGDLKLFQDEQVGQLYELMLESTKPNRQFDIQEEGFKK
ncbi:succinate dehydrogenase assembly factor 3, mitochondrial-like isoform X2 [Salvelinus fontinalis]|nr:succinate dehydrogenase assembly factor 3, mitochondrial-like isoform X2 [Salvelinus fontinalis]